MAAREAAADGAFEHDVHLIPAQREQLGEALLAGVAQPSAARRFGVQNDAELAGIEMPPAAFLLMVVGRAGGTAFRARPVRLLVVLQAGVDLAGSALELNARCAPRIIDPQNLSVQLAIVRPASLPDPGRRPLRSRKSRQKYITGADPMGQDVHH